MQVGGRGVLHKQVSLRDPLIPAGRQYLTGADKLQPLPSVGPRPRKCTLGSPLFRRSRSNLRCHHIPYGPSSPFGCCLLDIPPFQLYGVSSHSRPLPDAGLLFFLIRSRLPHGCIPCHGPCVRYWVSHPSTADEKVAVLGRTSFLSLLSTDTEYEAQFYLNPMSCGEWALFSDFASLVHFIRSVFWFNGE
jgi:hypothetical protein